MPDDEIEMENVEGTDAIGGDEIPVFPGDTPPEDTTDPDPKNKDAKPKKVKKDHPRVDASELLGTAWGFLGKGLERADYKQKPYGSFPTGRAMQLQAPLAGNYLDTIIRGTWIDKLIVQPLARAYGTAEGASALFALPIMIYAIDKKPEVIPTVEPYLRSAVYQTLSDMKPVIEKMQKEAERQTKALENAGVLIGGEPGQDPYEIFMNQVFSPPGGYANAQPEPEPEPAPQRPARPNRARRTQGGVS